MGAAIIVCGVLLGIGIALLVLPRGVRRPRSVRFWFDEAGLAGVPLAVIGAVMTTVAVIVGALTATVIPLPSVAPLGFVVGCGVPIVALASARDRRRQRARALWPDVIDSIRVALRSGSTLTDAMIAASAMVPKEWRVAWTELEVTLRRGSDVNTALRRLQRVLADPIADRVVEAIVVAREYGGTELPAVLTELGRSVRRESGMRREAQSRQSWVRHAATLGVVSPWIVLALLASRPENREAYSTVAGTILIVASAGATVVAYVAMRALGTLREPARWLIGALND
ncbi:MAG: type II secretion system F family protein [Microbacteriaceae bacterium]|nr:type II secretion system F family protein [Microbacteriaceae bacterium]